MRTNIVTALCIVLPLHSGPIVAQQIGPWRGANAVAGGYQHPLALKADGSVVVWGLSTGRGETATPSPNEGFVAVSGGYEHSLALKADGSILSWGMNLWGITSVPAPNADFVAVEAGAYHSLGLKADGRIVAWGKNDYGQTTVPSSNAEFVALAAGANHSLGLKADGSVVAWGWNNYGQTTVPSPNAAFVSVAGGYYHSLGLKADGHIVAWGRNVEGQTAVPLPNTDFVAISAGNAHSLGLKSDGSIVAWGYNNYGQTTVPSPNSDFVAVAAGLNYSLGLKANGSIAIWGFTNDVKMSVPLPNSDYGQQSGVVPPRGQVEGGTLVTVLGSQLGNGTDVTNVTLCGITATIITQSPSRILVSTGPAPGPSTGDVVVHSVSNPPITRTNAFTYIPAPTVVTRGITNITAWSAVGAGEVLSDAGYAVTDRGLCWGTTSNPSVSEITLRSGSGLGMFTDVQLQNLMPSTRYHVRAWARTAIGVGYGADVSFRTRPVVTALAGPYGTISPKGILEIEEGGAVMFTITPDPGCRVADLLVDGASVGTTNNYSFENVTTNHTLKARFAGSGGRWRFAALADSGYGELTSTGILAEIAQAIALDEPDLLIFSGDLVSTPSIDAFQQWTNVMAPLYQAGIAVYPVRGNHEDGDAAAQMWRATFSHLPTNGPPGEVGLTYSVTNKDAVFIGLDESVNPGTINQSWLTDQLSSNTQPHIFVFGHQPAFPTGSHIGSSLDAYPTNRNVFWSSLAASGVKAYFCGHEDFYDHARMDDRDGNPLNDVHQLIVGTTGTTFDRDSEYSGGNSLWTPVRQFHTNQYGYVLGEVNGNRFTLTWKYRLAPGYYAEVESSILALNDVAVFASPYGRVEPHGIVHVQEGKNVAFSFTPDVGYHVADVLVDGVSVGATNSYTLENVMTDHTISVKFWGIGPWFAANCVAAGGSHSLGLRSDGHIVAWGNNSSGQTTVPAFDADFVSVAAGGFLALRSGAHSLGLKSDGRIVAWGSNGSGQTAVPAPNTNFVAVAAGLSHSLGLKADGSIVAWGNNGTGQTTVPLPNTGFVAVASGGAHSLGLKSDRSIIGWGLNTNGQCNVPSPNADFVAVAGGGSHSLGLKSSGCIVAWGLNTNGQCNVPVPNTNFVAVAAGYTHSLALKSDGSIVAWGDNSSGQTTVPLPNTNFVAIAAGYSHSVGLKSDGRIVAWGNNSAGQTNVPATHSDFGGQSGIVPSSAPTDGSTVVIVLGYNLGNGMDVTNVTICGVPAIIIAQTPWKVTVQTRRATLPALGDVAVYSAGYGSIVKTNEFTYFTGMHSTNGTPQIWMDAYGLTNDVADTDGDGMPAWMEYVAGSDPTNASSLFAVTSAQETAADRGGFVVRWPSVWDRLYAVYRTTNAVLSDFEPIATNIAATPPVNVHTDVTAGLSNAVYRIRVRLP